MRGRVRQQQSDQSQIISDEPLKVASNLATTLYKPRGLYQNYAQSWF